MDDTKDTFRKEKILAFLTVLSIAVLCIQHFWGIFADATKIQVAYIPLAITFATITINEIAGSYKKKKKIAILSAIGAIVIAIAGISIVVTNSYGIDIVSNGYLVKGLFIFITAVTLFLDIFEIEKLVII